MGTKTDQRARNFRFLIYPESANKNWFDQLTQLHNMQGYFSPLHNPDELSISDSEDLSLYDDSISDVLKLINDQTKKQHIHGIICFDGKKSLDQVRSIINSVGGVVPPWNIAKIDNLRSAVRYLIHADNPEKEQFHTGREAILCVGGATLDRFFDLGSEEYDLELCRIRNIIREHGFTEISDLMDWCDKYDRDAAHLLNTRCAYVMSKYLDSRRHKMLAGELKRNREIIDEEP